MLNISIYYFRYGKKIWLTEFAKARTNNISIAEEHVTRYVRRLEESDFIYRYTYFVDLLLQIDAPQSNMKDMKCCHISR